MADLNENAGADVSIHDDTSGTAAIVTDDGGFVTDSQLGHRSHLGDAYNVFGIHTHQTAATTENVGFFTNAGANTIYLTSMVLQSNAPEVYWWILRNPTYTSGGLVRTPQNLNFGSANTSTMVTVDNSPNNLLLAGGAIAGVWLTQNTSNSQDTEELSGYILTPGDTAAIQCLSSTAGPLHVYGLYFYEVA